MAKHRNRTDWQLDLKPVALSTPRPQVAPGNENRNGSASSPVAVPESSAALTKAVNELRANDRALLEALGEIRTALDGLSAGIDQLATRVGAVEIQLTHAAAAPAVATAASRPARASRPLRDTSRALRDASAEKVERRPRRAALQVADEDTTL